MPLKYSGETSEGGRSHNEDSFETLTLEKEGRRFHLLAVADGLGGHSAGEVASKLALLELKETVKRSHEDFDDRESMQRALRKAIEKGNKSIIDQANNPARKGMATTLVAALLDDSGRGVVANIGDSRAYIVGKEGVRFKTTDHSYVQKLVNSGAITEEEAFGHPQKNIVERVLGHEERVEPDFYEIALESEEYLLISSDGLHDYVRNGEILKLLSKKKDMEIKCSALIIMAMKMGTQDNVSVILGSLSEVE